MATTALKVDVAQVQALVGKLERLTASEFASTTSKAINAVTERTYDLARDRMIAGINLTDDYLRRKMTVVPSSDRNLTASITASGGRDALTVLGRYDARPVIVANRGRGAGKGNKGLGIPPGQRQLGVTVQVTRGSRPEIERGFLLPLKRGQEAGGNGFGVFTRSRSGKVRHHYGPSVYQLFAYQTDRISDEVGADLETTVAQMVSEHMLKALE